MIQLKALSLSKRFTYDWVIKDFSYDFAAGHSYGITGPNGSGKSTLLQLLSGKMLPSTGKVELIEDRQKIDPDMMFRKLSFAAPYVELIDELSLLEMVRFHFHFKKIIAGVQFKDVMSIMGLEKHKNKPIAQFSSGMKQRCKLALAFLADSPVLFIDEPGTNLDDAAKKWYQEIAEKFGAGKLLIIASNEEEDISFCDHRIDITSIH